MIGDIGILPNSKRNSSRWTKRELQVLSENYASSTIEDLQSLFPGRSKQSIWHKARRIGIAPSNPNCQNPYNFNKAFFRTQNRDSCYWAGMLAADGNVSEKNCRVTLGLKTTDRNHVAKFKGVLRYQGPIRDYTSKPDRRTGKCYHISQVGVQSRDMVADLWDNFKVGPRKSLTLQPPAIEDKVNRYLFIVGYIDGDGCIRQRPGVKHLELKILGTKSFLEWVKSELDNLSPFSSDCNVRPYGEKIYTLSYGGFSVDTILFSLNHIPCPFKMERKWDKITQFIASVV